MGRLMQVGALLPYERSLDSHTPLRFRRADGRVQVLDVERWLAPADGVDRAALSRAVGPVLDVGCGPGRIVAALIERGAQALGIDIAATAVRLSRDRGAQALQCDVFGAVPDPGGWGTVVLLDGNIGIGGDPVRLLRRAYELLSPAGLVLVETDPDRGADERITVRFADGIGAVGPSFPWAHVGLDALRRYGLQAGLPVTETWESAGRTFAVLSR